MNGEEHRIATYLGGKPLYADSGELVLRQGELMIHAVLLEKNSLPLFAPSDGSMLSVTVNDDKGQPIKPDDLSALMDEDLIGLAAPISQSFGTIKSGHTEENAILYGTTAAYMDIQNLTLQCGRFLKTADISNNLYVVILGSDAAEKLYGDNASDALGQSVLIEGRTFTVVGVLAESDSMSVAAV